MQGNLQTISNHVWYGRNDVGYYIQGPTRGKGLFLQAQHGAMEVPPHVAASAVHSIDTIPVCVVDNGAFEAAGVAYDGEEFEAFCLMGDARPKKWYVMNRQLAYDLCNFPKVK